MVIEVADGVKVNVLRSTLSDVLNRSDPSSSSGGSQSSGGPTVVGPSENKSGGLLGGLFGGLGPRK